MDLFCNLYCYVSTKCDSMEDLSLYGIGQEKKNIYIYIHAYLILIKRLSLYINVLVVPLFVMSNAYISTISF